MMRRKEEWISLWKLIRCRAIHYPATLHHSPSTPHIHSAAKFNLFPNAPQFYAKRFCSESSGIRFPSCWNCNAHSQQLLFLRCDSCQAIQLLDQSLDYFHLFGLEKNYDVKENLDKKYKEWQKKLHPDLVHTKSEKEREFAAEQSARITDAYRSLSNPLLRAIYILKLEGVDVNEEETISEPQLLAKMREKLQHWANAFAKAFESRKVEEAIGCIRRMTYYDRVNEEIVKRL